MNHDFFILPTRAECSAIVFSEASAFGLPIISTRTGGVPDYVQDGVNGYCLPPGSGGSEYADLIHNIFHQEKKLSILRSTTREWYERELNWKRWLYGFEIILNRIRKNKFDNGTP
jgi:glycosyltransferase involved in cell wall biosynthesis